MKKLFFSFLMILSFSASVFAANSNDGFKPYWFVNLRGGAAYTVGEASFSRLLSPTVDLAFGYHFTPAIGLRADVNGWQGKGSPSFSSRAYSFNYIQAGADVLLDICNLFEFKSDRLFSPYLFAGAGAAFGFDNHHINSLLDQNFTVATKPWKAPHVFPAAHFGTGLDIRIINALSFNLEFATSLLPDQFNSKIAHNSDWQFELKAGLTFNFGKGNSKKAEYVAPVEPMVKEEPVKEEPVKETVEEPVKVVETTPVVKVCPEISTEVYFVIGKSLLRESEKANLSKVISLASEYDNARIQLTGFADKNTGSSKRNMYLSQKRAEAVKAYLIENGVSADRIEIDFKGDTVQPNDTPATNRVVICIIK